MSVTVNIKFPMTKAEIKRETERLEQEITTRRAEIKVLAEALGTIQAQCKHEGQKTGYNERDGSWANPCPTCGESH